MPDRITVARCKTLLATMGRDGKFGNGKFKTWTTGPWPGNAGGFFYIEVAYGKPKLHYALRGGGESDVSPRLPTGKLYEWLVEFYMSGGFRTFLKYKRIR